ncbi:acetyl-CoA carboxylase biotin carboxyl carrier protein [Saccharothrix hoggarensis]|uniref:Biotin carboxyl carrier protein of acetyl-CoA carboxylase n=1 Tax=Saccharothrix hoggarensis TaxID=913853 RepID=A0ABW3QQZ4_9PSEU
MSTDAVITYGTSPQDPFDPPMSLAELRAEAEHLILTMGRPVRRVHLRAGRNEVEVDWEAAAVPAAPAAGTATAIAPTPAPPAPTPPSGLTVRSPLVGTFYAAPNPGAAPFVAVGDVVAAGDQLAIVEAMKLLNPITADRAGRITAVLAGDGDMVEFDQPLFEFEPVD